MLLQKILNKIFHVKADECHDGHLEQQDHGNADGEFQVAGLVTESVHTDPCTKTAAQGCHEEEGSFADAPAFFLCPELVLTHKEECKGIDC